jgi:arylsulfatase A-like enzyme
MKESYFVRITAYLLTFSLLAACSNDNSEVSRVNSTKPNIIYILADDLGYNELGVYGQTKIKTPNLDTLANQGILFTQHYSGSAVCAPSRSTFIEGKQTNHSYVRGNVNNGHADRLRGNHPLPDTRTMGDMFKEQGYATAAIGKWGLGGLVGTGHPNDHGFDLFYGYLDQIHAHNYYPEYLIKNRDFVELNNPPMTKKGWKKATTPTSEEFAKFQGEDFAGDLMNEQAIEFIERSAANNKPFFLYYPTPIPHVALQLPDEALAKYQGQFEETPYHGNKGYFPHQTPRAAYAGMVTLMDSYIGELMETLRETGQDKNTLIIFTSDNGPTFNGGSDSEFFDSAKPFRGLKMDLYEGGIRAPFIAYWPEVIAPGQISDLISAQWDMMATFADIIGGTANEDTDGISILPTLSGNGVQKKHAYLQWEYPEKNGQQAIRMGKWKAIRTNIKNNLDAPVELYDLSKDINESNNLANIYPEQARKMKALMQKRTPASHPKWELEGYSN